MYYIPYTIHYILYTVLYTKYYILYKSYICDINVQYIYICKLYLEVSNKTHKSSIKEWDCP